MGDQSKPVLSDVAKDGTVIRTFADEVAERRYRTALSTYDPTNRFYSAYLNDSATSQTLSNETISSLGQDAQSNLSNIQQINAIIRQYANTDDLIGMVVQSIQNNINTEVKKSFKNFDGKRNKSNTLKNAQAILNDFDNQVRIEQFVRDAIITAYMEGNYASVLRNNAENW